MSIEALQLFHAMARCENVDYNVLTLYVVLLACVHLGALQVGRHVHDQFIKMDLEGN